jgi:hypothetical protein
VTAWVGGQHHVAQRLVQHASLRYETDIEVTYSRRPWLDDADDALSGNSGVLFHVTFASHRYIHVDGVWRDTEFQQKALPYLVHMLVDSPMVVGFTWAAVDGGERPADVVGTVFDAVLRNTNQTAPYGYELGSELQRFPRPDDYRVHYQSPWNVLDYDLPHRGPFGA